VGRCASYKASGHRKARKTEADTSFRDFWLQALDIPQNRQQIVWKNLTKAWRSLAKSLAKKQKGLAKLDADLELVGRL